MTTEILISCDRTKDEEEITVAESLTEAEIINYSALIFNFIWDVEDDSKMPTYDAIAEKINKLIIDIFKDLIAFEYEEADKDYPVFIKVLIEILQKETK